MFPEYHFYQEIFCQKNHHHKPYILYYVQNWPDFQNPYKSDTDLWYNLTFHQQDAAVFIYTNKTHYT